jgi:hypothetical protein
MTLGVSMLKNIFLLYNKMQIYYLNHPIYSTKCHNVNKLSLKEVTYFDE